MLDIAPELVKMELAVSTDVPYTQSYLLYTPITQLEPSGVWGHAKEATAEKGRRYHERYVPAAVKAIQETFEALERVQS
jgi:creatinine amidohydrolase/Fe(II)-dependent formamide hydrolase-like protein